MNNRVRQRNYFFVLYVLILALALGVGGKFIIQKRFVGTPAPLCKDCNVILISLDTLSANHLPCYGYARDTTPNLCAFAKENILFSHAYANGMYTLPSHVSVFTGLNPNMHGVIAQYTDSLSKNIPFLPEILQKNGYTTLFVLPKADAALPLDSVYNRGIDKLYLEQAASWDKALQGFAANVNQNKKTFLFLHTYTVHAPYFIGNEPKLYTTDTYPAIPLTQENYYSTSKKFYQELYKEIQAAINNGDIPPVIANYKEALTIIANNNYNPQLLDSLLLQDFALRSKDLLSSIIQNIKYDYHFDIHNPRDVAYLQALYDQRIHQMDQIEITTVLRFLSSHERIRKSTVVIVMADHGEEFMEHGAIYHATVYDSNLHVPLIFSIPGNKQSKQIATPVQLIDLTPTILDILGVPRKYDFQGDSLVGVIGGRMISDRLLVADGRRLHTLVIRTAQWKLHVKRNTDSSFTPYELYDIQKDPGEQQNVLFSHLDVADSFISQYQPYELRWRKKINVTLNTP